MFGSVKEGDQSKPAGRRCKLITIFLIGMFLLGSIMVGTVMAGGGGGGGGGGGAGGNKPVKMAITGDTLTPLASIVTNLALDKGIHVYDRSKTVIGIIRAEANLMIAHGSDEAGDKAQEVLKNLESEFFADIWIDFDENHTTEMTTVTIKVGTKTATLTFPTPLTEPEKQARAQEIFNTAMSMKNS